MPYLPYILIGSAVLALVLVVIIRTVRFVPKHSDKITAEAVFVNTDKATADLSEMIKCKTISDRCHENEDEREFDKFKALLPTLFPGVYSVCEYEEVGNRALLFRWRGKNSDTPTVLMSHYDVVSVEEDEWEKDAFGGILENGVLYGRGTLDTKGTLNGILQAAEALIAEGFVPKHDIYFAFAGDEEINGHGASDIVALFQKRGIEPGMVLDEGGAVVENVFPGVKAPIAMIGISEKGMLNVEYSIKGGGGHASNPKPHTPVGRLSAACVAIENRPFGFRIGEPVSKMFDTVARHSTFVFRMIFANLWLFRPVLNILTKKTGGELNAMVRTTVAFTQMEGSKGMNVIPPNSRMVSNLRLNHGDTKESALEYLKSCVKDKGIEIREIDGMNPARISTVECEAYETLKATVAENWQDVIVSPYLMFACSDSRHWGEISDKVYRFSAMALTKDERATIHGNNEHIPVGTIAKIAEFYVRLMKKC